MARDGAVIETLGPWEVRGQVVVFRLPDGTLSSMRLRDVDIEASHELARAGELATRQRAAAETLRAAVLETVSGWAEAWSDQRVEDYLSYYVEGYRPASGMDAASWRALRRARLEGPSYIELEIGPPELERLAPGRVRVTFTQRYRSDRYQDEVLKSLELVGEGGSWRIAREEAAPLPEERTAIVLRDRDLPRAEPAAEEAPAEATEPAPAAAERGWSGRVRVAEWSEQDGPDDGREIRGLLTNRASRAANELTVRALFYNQADVLISALDVPLASRDLGPGSTVEFTLALEETLEYERVAFQVSGRGFRASGQSPAAVAAGEPEQP